MRAVEQMPKILYVAAVVVLVGCHSLSTESDEESEMEREVTEPGWTPMQVVEGEALDDGEIERLVQRLPDLEAEEEDEVEFKRRDESLPPPLTGEDIDGEWPPDLSDPAAQPAPEGPLVAQAFRPTGEVRPPFQVAVAFDRPVVEIGAVGTQEIPELEMAPEIEGRWRWLGTQTVVFEPADRWPMATEFEISVQSGLEAVDGAQLDETLRFEFTTPAPEVQTIYPRTGPQATDTPVAVVFNQAIDLQSAEAIRVTQGADEIPMEVLQPGAGRADAIEQWGLQEAEEQDRVIVLAPQRSFAGGDTAAVHVDGPLASAQGPVVGMASESWTFEVRGPFELDTLRCGGRHGCTPLTTPQAVFSNPVDADESNLDVQADPPVDDLSARVSGRRISLQGDFQPKTRYTVTFPAGLYDVFGQPLEGDRSAPIDVGAYPPFFAGPDQTQFVRPVGSAPHIPVRVAGLESLRVRLYDVSPEDWDHMKTDRWGAPEIPETLKPDVERTLQFSEEKRHQNREISVDYSSIVDADEPGHAIVVIDQPEPWTGRRTPTWVYWVQHSDLSVDLATDHRNMTALVTSIADGSPVEGATLESVQRRLGETDETGETRFSVPRERLRNEPIVVRHGSDSLVIPVRGNTRRFRTRTWWRHRAVSSDLLWYVVDDRQMYRPGETVHLRGWVRSLENSPRSDPEGIGDGETVEYVVRESRRNEIAEGEVDVDRFGGFELDFEVPDEANLGRASIQLKVAGRAGSHRHQVQFQEFRRPEYEVTLDTDEGPHLVARDTRWEAEASYYAGGAVSGAPTAWRFSERSATYRPPGWQGWTFGAWSPWWWHWRGSDSSEDDRQVLPEAFAGGESGETDARGRDEVSMTFEEPERGFPRRVEGTVSVTDVNRQSWEGTDSVLVHPAQLYVGLRAEQNYIHRDESWEVEAVVVDIDGERVDGTQIEIAVQRRRGSETSDVDGCTVESAEAPNTCSFSNLSPGSYQVVARVEDDRGRRSESEVNFWVAGRDTSGAETAEEDELRLIPERDEFAVGDTARLFVQAPYYPLEAVVELRRDGLYDRRQVTITDADPVVEVDLEEAMIPNVHVQISALGAGDAYAADHFASGSIELEIDRAPRSLDVRIDPADTEFSPGADIGVDLQVLDPAGQPVEDAQVFLFAVDESVLALSNYELRDPLSTFYPTRRAAMSDIRTRSWLLLDGEVELDEDVAGPESQASGPGRGGAVGSAPLQAERMARAEPSPMADAPADDAGGDQEPIELREVFDALAFYRSDLVTDERGRVSVTETLPDSLTRYRLMAVAVEGDRHFGTAEEDVTVRKPLMVRPSPPRFLNVGDQFGLPVVVHNRTDDEKTVDVALRATAGLEWTEGPGRRIEVPADGRVEVRFPARAKSAGTTRVQVAATSGALSDAELATFPILTPATTEAFATYGSMGDDDDDAIAQALNVPTDAYSQYGGLEVSASSTQLQALTDAFIYLTTYRFSCSEQLASRILSVLALYDVLDAFDAADLPDPDALRGAMDQWIDELIQLQRRDGGFGFWPGARKSSPFASVHATLALWMAGEAGYDVPSRRITQATRYIGTISRHLGDYRHRRSKAAVEAYALHVRHQMGEASTSDLENLLGRYGIEDMPLEGLGWLLPLAEGTQFEARFMERITGQVQETAATAEFQETYPDDAHRILHTTRRTDGVVLDGLMRVDPDHYLIEKVVRGLLGHRSRGRWSNTQENVFILMALKRYFDTYEAVEPDFVARAWLGEDQIAEHGFHGRTTDRYGVDVPMRFLQDNGERKAVILQRDGQGRMYYRVGVRYAPKSRHLPALNQGFSVQRQYEAVDDPDDVQRTEDGWEIEAGARVRVELSMAIPARRTHVALVDWLPAGFEPINPALSVSDVEADLTAASTDRPRWGWWGWPWYEHQNLRDERVEAFSSLVSEGVHTYSYVARATTPGEFIAMPAKAEEMYHPETFGRSSTEIVRIE